MREVEVDEDEDGMVVLVEEEVEAWLSVETLVILVRRRDRACNDRY